MVMLVAISMRKCSPWTSLAVAAESGCSGKLMEVAHMTQILKQESMFGCMMSDGDQLQQLAKLVYICMI